MLMDITCFYATRSALRISMGDDGAFGLAPENIYLNLDPGTKRRKSKGERIDTEEDLDDLFLTMVFS